MASIYLASSWRNADYPYVLDRLRSAGHNVYDFRNPAPGDDGFKWEAIDPNWKEWTAKEYRSALNHPLAEKGFKHDFDAMRAADVCVLLLPCGRSAHLEAGWMSGAGKKVIVLTRDGEEPELMAKLCTAIATSIGDCLSWLTSIDDPKFVRVPPAPKTATSIGYVKDAKATPGGISGTLTIERGEKPRKGVPELMRDAADVFEERSKVYGENYKRFGDVMMGMFPEGLKLETASEFSRFALFMFKAAKATRYAENFKRGGHDDSLLDDSVYSNMLRQLDADAEAEA